MRVLNTPKDLEQMKMGETARLGKLRLRLAEKPYDEEQYRCSECRYLFYAVKSPKFCPGCGARWNGKGSAAAVEEG